MKYYFQLTIPRFLLCMFITALFVIFVDVYLIPWIEKVINHE